MQQKKKSTIKYLTFNKISVPAQMRRIEVPVAREAGPPNQAEQKLNLFLPHHHYRCSSWSVLASYELSQFL